jgi:hypothetical protein
MSLNKYAFVVENEVFDVFTVHELFKPEYAAKVNAGMQSNPVGMDVTEYPEVCVGWSWDGEQFVSGTVFPYDGTYYEQTGTHYPENSGAFAFLAEGEVFFLMFLPDWHTNYSRYKAAFQSSPTAILIPEGVAVTVGSVWDGETFINTVG